MSALAVTHRREVGGDVCPIKVETIPIGFLVKRFSGSGVRDLLYTTQSPLLTKKNMQEGLISLMPIARHKIDESSPLFNFGPQQLADGMMEVKMIVLWSFVLFGIYLLCLHLLISR